MTLMITSMIKVYYALDEYRATGCRTKKSFSAQAYKKIYQDLLRGLEIIKEKEHHKAKWNRIRREWAEIGM